MQPLRGIVLKILSVCVFVVMASLIKATVGSCPARSGSVLSVLLCDAGDRGLAAVAA